MKTQKNIRESATVNQIMGFQEWGLIIILSILWGGSFFFVGVAVQDMPPLTIVLCRVALASILLLAAVYLKGDRMPSSLALWGGFIVMGALNNLIPFSLIVWGQTHIESGLASILNGTTPIFSVILAHFLTKEERLTTNRMSGVLIGWVGVAVLIGFNSLRGFGIEVYGQIAVLGAALSYACAAIYGRRFKGLSPLVVATGMLCGSTIMMTPMALFVDQPWNLSPSIYSMAALFGLAAISTSLAYIIYFRVLSIAGPTNLLLVTFLIPLSAILLGVMFLGERLEWNAFVGMGLVFTGLIAIDGRLLDRFQRKEKVWYYEI
ncbi:ABC transporter permease [Desulfosarcina alkanivorans]|uniref:ABC transporter permease n=1 Tax=Desulfosarcina alkanivorans TaxID=571177 RepID=A0A5K7YM39_9BACT|nr:DMT family transporter [Desulfosarcina alkanivorans]BBO69445.1 ABC transporter permease [Desulfosarcina alkanivorans]